MESELHGGNVMEGDEFLENSVGEVNQLNGNHV